MKLLLLALHTEKDLPCRKFGLQLQLKDQTVFVEESEVKKLVSLDFIFFPKMKSCQRVAVCKIKSESGIITAFNGCSHRT